MKLERFKVERWMDEYEGFLTYDLGETCIDSLKVGEMLELCGEDPDKFLSGLKDERLVYGWIHGSPKLKKGIAGLYKDLTTDDIVPTHGGISANHMVLATLVDRGDNVVTVLPTYQQHYSIPESIGAEVRALWLKKENEFVPDLEEMEKLIDNNTKLISICNPDNPTGAFIPIDVMKEIVKMADGVGAYILCDEVYRGISQDGSYMYSIADIYDKGISTASMSKVLALLVLESAGSQRKTKMP